MTKRKVKSQFPPKEVKTWNAEDMFYVNDAVVYLCVLEESIFVLKFWISWTFEGHH